MAPEDRLIVLSDHGFDTFRRSVHLNRWLAETDYLGLRPGQPDSDALFTNVDWSKTRRSRSGSTASF